MSEQSSSPPARTVTLKVACLNLRNKAMYSDGEQDVRGMVDETIDTIPFFCTLTCDCLGPDNEPVSPQDCKPERACYCGQKPSQD
jgi:hypothetical protein